MPLAPTPSPTFWTLPIPSSHSPSPTFVPSPTPSKEHADIWRVDYNAMVERDAAMGWQGLGYVLMINTVMFAFAFFIFMRFARSTRFSLYHFRTSATSPPPARFTMRKWAKLLWRTPIQGTDVEKRLGPEGTFYLVYQVYALRLLLALSVYASLVLIPLYLGVGVGILPDFSNKSNGTNANTLNSTTNVGVPTPTTPTQLPLPTSSNVSVDLLATELASSAAPPKNATGNEWWSFAHITIRSLPNDSPYLWVPVATCYIFTAAFMVFFHRLSFLASIPTANGRTLEHSPASTRTTTPPRASSKASSTTSSTTSAKSKPPRTPVKKAQDAAQRTEETTPLLPVVVADVLSLTVKEDGAAEAAAASAAVSESESEAKEKKEKEAMPHLTGMQASALSLRSLFVDRGFPKNLREERLLFLLQEVFPGYVDDVCVVYNLSRFFWYQGTRVQKEARFDREKLLYEQTQVRGERASWSLRLLPGSMKFPYLHRILLAWFCCRQEPFDEDQMRSLIQHLKQNEDDSLSNIIKNVNGAGRAFLIFKSSRLRARFVRRVRNASVASILAKFPDAELPRLKRYVRELGITRWHLSAAPEPDDIDWLSVSFPIVQRTAVVIIVNVLILALLFTFTSPVAVTSAISSGTSYSNNAAKSLSDFVSSISDMLERFSPHMAKMMNSYIPTLILVIINAVLLNVLQIAGRIQPIATDSAKERNILRMSAVYLIFNTIFVPSLAFVSIDAVLLYLQTDGQVLDMLGTLFLHNSGIFYVNYVLQRCFLGTAVNLLRVSEFAKFCWEKPRAVTPQEHVAAIEAWPFFTGTMSAIQISMLTVVMIFSTVVPLILPIGALYFAMQHAVDKYALMYVRPRIKGRGSIARTGTHATIFSLLIYQGAMSGFFLVRGTKMQSSSVLVLLMGTYIVSLWWYIRDKERAYGQTRKGHHVHGPQCKKKHRLEQETASQRERQEREQREAEALPPVVRVRHLASINPDAEISAHHLSKMTTVDLEAQEEMLLQQVRRRSVIASGGVGEESDLYRAPALRKYGKNSSTVRAAVERARRNSYGTLGGLGSQSMENMRDSFGGSANVNVNGFANGNGTSSSRGGSAPHTPLTIRSV